MGSMQNEGLNMSMQIITLTQSNWKYWCAQIRPLLQMKKCFDATTQAAKPEDITDGVWSTRQQLATFLIKQSLSEEMLLKVSEEDNPFNIMNKLKDYFEGSGTERSVRLVKKLKAIETDFISLNDFGQRLNQIKSEFQGQFDFSKDDFWVAYALDSLPPQFDNLRITLKAKNDLTLAQLISFLDQESSRQDGPALLAKMQSKYCRICETNSHNTEECRSRRRKPGYNSKGNYNQDGNNRQRQNHRRHNNNHKQQNKQQSNDSNKNSSTDSQALVPNNSAPIRPIFACLKTSIKARLSKVTLRNDCVPSPSNSQTWYLDSGATHHVVSNRSYLSDLVIRDDITLESPNNADIGASGIGRCNLTIDSTPLILREAIFAPAVEGNFISVARLNKSGIRLIFEPHTSKPFTIAQFNGQQIFTASLDENGLYRVNFNSPKLCAIASNVNDKSIIDWHRRLGHLNFSDMNRIRVDLQIEKQSFNNLNCETCAQSKLNRLPFSKSSIKTNAPFQLVHADTSGTIHIRNHNNYNSYLVFVDDFTRFCFVYLLKNKTEVFQCFQQFNSLIKNQTNSSIKCLRSDNGTEFKNSAFTSYCKSNGIIQQFSNVNTPQQNGVAERMNRTIKQGTVALLHDANLNASFWPYAVMATVYNRNRSPSSAVNYEIPFELINSCKPDYTSMHTFGTKVYVHRTDPISKYEPTGQPGIFVGYPPQKRGYLIYLPFSKTFVESRDVLFTKDMYNPRQNNSRKEEPRTIKFFSDDLPTNTIESQPAENMPNQKDLSVMDEAGRFSNQEQRPISSSESSPIINESISVSTSPSTPTPIQQLTDENAVPSSINEIMSEDSTIYLTRSQFEEFIRTNPDVQIEPIPGRPRKVQAGRTKASAFRYRICYMNPKFVVDSHLKSPESAQWFEAMQDEFISHRQKGTWKLVPRPPNTKVIEGMWVLRKKIDDGQTKFKARFVAKGYRQRYGIDYNETFAPVIRVSSIRLLISIALLNDLHIHHVDVKTAYLNSPLTETIYMQQPYLFEEGKDLVCKLERAIYGLKQSARCWHERLSRVLHDIGFEKLNSENCIFFKRPIQMIIGFYVDDLIILARDLNILTEVKRKIAQQFDITDKGSLRCFLGINVSRSSNEFKLSQEDFVDELLLAHGMSNCKGVGTPIAADQDLSNMNDSPLLEDKQIFQSIVGSAIYLANGTRPDIQFAVGQLCKFMSQPRQAHLQAAKHLLRYLKATRNSPLIFSKNAQEQQVEIFCDADFANDKQTSKSVSGVIVFHHGNPISWSSHIQQTVATSTCEAEILAIKEGVQDAVYFVHLIREIIQSNDFGPITIYNDNQSAIRTIESNGKFSNNRHYLTRINFIRDYIRQGFIRLIYKQTEEMLADGFTKALPKAKFEQLFTRCGLGFR